MASFIFTGKIALDSLVPVIRFTFTQGNFLFSVASLKSSTFFSFALL